MISPVDLHLHTNASDGRLAPTELVRLVAERGLKVVSIADHDTTEGLEEAFESAKQFPDLRIIPGIEINTDIPGDEVHVLGYFIQYRNEEFQEKLRRFRTGRIDRARRIVEKLAALGVVLDWERVREIAGDGAVGRPHIALAMVENGYCSEPKRAFDEYLGRNSLAYVEHTQMTPVEAIQLLAGVGGVPVLAHPAYISNFERLLPELKAAGLMGMEVYYAKFDEAKVEYLKRLASEHDLIPCGGSDYHALGNSDEPLPGTLGPPVETVERLEAAAGRDP
ncbi:MAG: phosphatase [SAR202 cluster bacterium Io17-Chloro-G9]|nr:MAG: phosphatase [SAR202 cluster bacterium Io17-Chloro-G9]